MNERDSDSSTVLRANAIRFSRGSRTILDSIDLTLASGNVVALLGNNGAGKSTLLRILLGLLKPDAGNITLDDTALRELRASTIARRIAYVPQTHHAAFPYTVTQMVMLGRVPHRGLTGRVLADDLDAVASALERMQLLPLARRIYSTLSGGERQRVLLARALAQGSRLLVLDEPLAGLDYGQQLRLNDRLMTLAASGYGVLTTTHQPDHAFHSANQVLLLAHGRIVAAGAPADVINGDAMSRLYDLPLQQLDVGGHRFFVSDSRSRSE